MTTLFCSKKLEQFLKKVDLGLEPDYGNKFGNWNGNLFTVQGKKYILFTNDQTSYSFVWGCVKKSEIKDFGMLFRDSLIRQLDYDLKINERQEIEIRNSLTDLRLTSTNNNKRTLGIMNEFVHVAKHFLFRHGGPGSISDLELGYGLNNQFFGITRGGSRGTFVVPKELMLALLLK